MKRTLPFVTQVLAVLSVIALSLFPIACGTPATPPPVTVTPPAVTVTPPAVTVTPPSAAVPTIHIETPLPFTLTPTGDLLVTVKVTNFKLVDKIGQPNVPGEGHIDWYMDIDVPVSQTHPAIPKFAQHYYSPATFYTWKNVPTGTRQFAVQLVGNDHSPLAVPVMDSIVLNVVSRATGPAIFGAITTGLSDGNHPEDFYYDSASKQAIVSVSTRNFKIVDVSSQTAPANVPGEGHFIFYMDYDPPVVGKINLTPGSVDVSYKPSYVWKNVQPGYHTFSVQLVTNDNQPIAPPCIYKIAVNLVAP